MNQRKSSITNMSKTRKIPPPPASNVSWEKQTAYFEKYSWAELEAAGYGRDLTPKEKRELKQLEQLAKIRLAERKRASSKNY